MNRFISMMNELDPRTIAQRVDLPHQEAQLRYHLTQPTVDSFTEFKRIIGDFYAHQFSACISNGGRPSREYAEGQAETILEREYRRRNSDIVGAYRDAQLAMNGGMSKILQTLAEGIKYEAVQLYTRDVFERYAEPSSWDEKVAIVRQFIAEQSVRLGEDIDPTTPERYAANFQPLIQSFVDAMRHTKDTARRM